MGRFAVKKNQNRKGRKGFAKVAKFDGPPLDGNA
jgi:hypothetical protein